jgi:putative ABC transport system permease protein
VAGAVVTAGGLTALGAGLFGGAALAVVGLGAAVTFLGITVLLPLLSRGLARLLGAPLPRLAGMTGKLARDNAMRNPKRTASTAAALMVGLALVASVSVLASSLKASLGSDIERTLQSELVLQQAERGGLSPDVARAVRGTEGVQAVSELGWAQAKVEGALTGIAPVDPVTVEQVVDLGLRSGEVSALSGATVLVHEGVAEDRGWSVGDDVAVEWPQTGDTTLRVAGVFSEKDAVSADYLVSLDTFDANATGRLDVMVLLKTAAGTDVSAVQDAVIDAVAPYPGTQVLTGDELTASIAGEVDQLMMLMTAMLLLAVVIALMGIVNTLALSVFERTREIGLLRAVGMTRTQVRRMVRWESVIIAGIGAVTGSAVGLAFGVAFVTALEEQGVSELSVPGPRLAVYVAAAAVAGVLAALGPARRAADVDVLKAVVTD